MKRIAVIDLGSNTIRLVIYEVDRERFSVLVNEKAFLGIIRYVDKNRLTEDGVDHIIDTLKDFSRLIGLVDCGETFCFSTASLRWIENAEEVCARILHETGIAVRRLSGEEEASYDAGSLLYAVPGLQSGVGCDVGGGSGQVFTLHKGRMEDCVSLPIGCLRLYNEFVKGLLPSPAQEQKMYLYVKTLLREQGCFSGCRQDTLYAMGGAARATVKLFRALVPTHPKKDGVLAVTTLGEMLDVIHAMELNGVKLLNKILPERTHTILPGIIILKAIADTVGAEKIQVIQTGVREGFLIENVIRRPGSANHTD